ncbi:hypothetical protein BDZ97DRAFT_109412 [Flammula alnicola]|nr:hypothetical protein BDZ97DRAFT_109412 [Flammula alnicola]
MALRVSVIDDTESGKEFERIRQNFTTNVVGPNVPANVTDTQAAFQELQTELHNFLAQYVDKVIALQGRISNNLAANGSNDTAPEGRGIVAPTSDRTSSRISNTEPQTVADDGFSSHAKPYPPTRLAKVPVDAHLHDLHAFLNTHLDNIHRLQSLTHSPKRLTHSPQEEHGTDSDGNTKKREDFTQRFSILIVTSTFTAVLIVTFLSLVIAIIGPKHRTPFSIGMLFSFLALALHLGSILLAGRGIAITTQADAKHEGEYSRFYLGFCEQLQFMAALLFIISITIMTFFIFTSLAFPLVLLFLSVVGALIVFSSAYWEVPITFRNLKYLAKNIRHIKSAIEIIKYNRKATTVNRF